VETAIGPGDKPLPGKRLLSLCTWSPMSHRLARSSRESSQRHQRMLSTRNEKAAAAGASWKPQPVWWKRDVSPNRGSQNHGTQTLSCRRAGDRCGFGGLRHAREVTSQAQAPARGRGAWGKAGTKRLQQPLARGGQRAAHPRPMLLLPSHLSR